MPYAYIQGMIFPRNIFLIMQYDTRERETASGGLLSEFLYKQAQ